MLDFKLWSIVSPDQVELEAGGRHHLCVRLLFECDGREGDLLLPFVVIHRGPGPSVLVVGGTHGDEFEGQIIVSNLCREIDPGKVRGTIVLLPLHNVAACLAGTRLTPGDDADLNRVYGVSRGDGPAHAIARFVEGVLLPKVDWVIDLHSGGVAHEFVLSSNLQASAASAELEGMLEPLLAFDAPYAIVFDELSSSAQMPHAGTLEGLARSLGKKAISSELGGAGRVTPASRIVADHGLRSLLTHIDVVTLPGATRPEQSRSRLMFLGRPEHYVACTTTGRFAPAVWLGDEVQKGDLLGAVNPLHDPLAAPDPIFSLCTGVVVAVASRSLQQAGNVVFYIAEEHSRERASFTGWRTMI